MSNLYDKMIQQEDRYPISNRLFDYLRSTGDYAVTMSSDNQILQAVWYLKDEMKLFALMTLQCETCAFLESRGFPKGGQVFHIYDEPCRVVWDRPMKTN